MEINITCEQYYSDDSTKILIEYLKENEKQLNLEESIVYYNYPMFKELDDELQYPSLCIVSKSHGVILILTDNILERYVDEDYINKSDEKLSQLYSLIHAKFFKIKDLKKNRNSLSFSINTFMFFPNFHSDVEELENELLSNLNRVQSFINEVCVNDNNLNDDIVEVITASLEGATGIVKPLERIINSQLEINTKGKVLVELEKEMNNLDRQQKFAALTQINGPQRIRGLAGSGKTIILCMKAANILMKNPNAKILYTFYTKSLYEHIKLLISRFYRVYSEKDPDFENKIHVRHAWGGKNYAGVYYDACKRERISPLTLKDARGMNKFDFVCTDLLEKTNGQLNKEYDYVIIDEAQDFSPVFYWLCRKIVKNDNLVWAYDQLQNILNVEIQDTITLFENKYGDKGIDLEKLLECHPELNNDIVLPVCYRNPREILMLAHSIGFGLYNSRVIQVLENADHWSDNGYEIIQGAFNEGEETIITRPVKNSPLSISQKYSIDEIIEIYKAESFDAEIEWIAESIKGNLEEELLPHDIMIICLDQKNISRYAIMLANILGDYDIYMNNTIETYNNEFNRNGCVTYTSVYKAKGNESALVYVVGCDSVAVDKDDIIMRNKLFTAFTRSKAWLKISGIGKGFEFLEEEIKKAKDNYPNLKFIYPNKDMVKQHQRDLSKMNEKKEMFANMVKEFAKKAGLTTEEAIEMFKDSNTIEGIIKNDNLK